MIAPARTRVTTPFGWVKGYPLYPDSYPGYGNAPGPGYGFHTGVDFSWSPDDTIYMPENGVVQVIPWNGTSYDGNAIVVAVGNRRHFMGHIKNGGFLVSNGQFVAEGTPIAKMGDTGFAIGRHLHWGLRVDGKIVNGLDYVKEKPVMTREQAIYMAQRIGLLAFMSEAQITAEWLDYHAKNIMADPFNYPAALCKQLYEGKQWQEASWKNANFEKEVEKAYQKGKAEGDDGDFVPVAEVGGTPTLFAKVPKQ